jgi:hypothetical protein
MFFEAVDNAVAFEFSEIEQIISDLVRESELHEHID